MVADLLINLVASVILLGFGYVAGQYRERRREHGKNLSEYPFYPFGLDESKYLHFEPAKFETAVDHFLRRPDRVAMRQLVLVGQQNDVEHLLTGEAKQRYHKLYDSVGGDQILDDTAAYLENYKRIVRLIGDSFPDTGIEILLHNLSNPAKALCYIKNTVTGRNVEAPATNLVLDLKTRGLQNQDKLNYELNIGARKFKCTTIPIYRERLGLIGAICINVDVNYLRDEAGASSEKMHAFIDSLCKTDMQLGENILSKDEHKKALAGKRHFRDFSSSAA
jgi:predicted transcriptional regulator YheO